LRGPLQKASAFLLQAIASQLGHSKQNKEQGKDLAQSLRLASRPDRAAACLIVCDPQGPLLAASGICAPNRPLEGGLSPLVLPSPADYIPRTNSELLAHAAGDDGCSKTLSASGQARSVRLKDGQEASFYYSYLRANRRDGERLTLMHVSAMIAMSGPSELLAEAHRLVSQQRLAGVRDGEEGLVVEIEWTEAMND
jgi:hypothetical protein